MTTWRCFCCDASGVGSDSLEALIGFERHYLIHHYQRGALN